MSKRLDAWSSATDAGRSHVKQWLMPDDDPESIVLHVLDHPTTRHGRVVIEWYDIEVYDARTGAGLCQISVKPTAHGDELVYTWPDR